MNKKVKVKECRYCDGTISHRPYGDDEPAVCMNCGAEWDPVVVEYDYDEYYGTDEDDMGPAYEDDVEWCVYDLDKECTYCKTCF